MFATLPKVGISLQRLVVRVSTASGEQLSALEHQISRIEAQEDRVITVWSRA